MRSILLVVAGAMFSGLGVHSASDDLRDEATYVAKWLKDEIDIISRLLVNEAKHVKFSKDYSCFSIYTGEMMEIWDEIYAPADGTISDKTGRTLLRDVLAHAKTNLSTMFPTDEKPSTVQRPLELVKDHNTKIMTDLLVKWEEGISYSTKDEPEKGRGIVARMKENYWSHLGIVNGCFTIITTDDYFELEEAIDNLRVAVASDDSGTIQESKAAWSKWRATIMEMYLSQKLLDYATRPL